MLLFFQVDRRWAWFRRLLKMVDLKFSSVCPPHWRLPLRLCLEFTDRTKVTYGCTLFIILRNKMSSVCSVFFSLSFFYCALKLLLSSDCSFLHYFLFSLWLSCPPRLFSLIHYCYYISLPLLHFPKFFIKRYINRILLYSVLFHSILFYCWLFNYHTGPYCSSSDSLRKPVRSVILRALHTEKRAVEVEE